MSRLVNLTPHPLNLEGLGTVPPSGETVPRVEMTSTPVAAIDGVPIVATAPAPDAVAGLAALLEAVAKANPGSVLVVSRVVAEAARDLELPLVVPDDLIRDDEGKVTGARRLAAVSPNHAAAVRSIADAPDR